MCAVGNILDLDAHFRVLPHPLDLLADGGERVEAPPFAVE
jgi:hypothetical protein